MLIQSYFSTAAECTAPESWGHYFGDTTDSKFDNMNKRCVPCGEQGVQVWVCPGSCCPVCGTYVEQAP